MAKRIPLFGQGFGRVAWVDDEDFDRLCTRIWTGNKTKGAKTFYAISGRWVFGRTNITHMHREVLGVRHGQGIDHKNCDGLDNRKENLRLCTPEQNAWNREKFGNGKASRYKGVGIKRRKGQAGFRWRARISVSGRVIELGDAFHDELSAALAYDDAARKYHGNFARLNFPRVGEQSA